MRNLRKRIQAKGSEVRANLDAAILGLRNNGFEQLKEKLDQARTRLDTDTAWNVATRVLEKVRAVRESMAKAAPVTAKAASMSAKPKARKPMARKPKAATNGKGKARKARSGAKAPKRAH
jgi:hypothetical protein